MSWLWGSSKSTDDATSNLDPSLRDFLDKENAKQQDSTHDAQRTATPTQSRGASLEYTKQLGLDVPGQDPRELNKTKPEQERAQVPPESAFQDGRYAHLWKTYRAPEELAAATMTDQDKLSMFLTTVKDRKDAIGKAAIQNCVVEQLAQHECFIKGSYSDLMTLCRKEGKAFNRCYEMQTRFLKALGYLSQPRSQEEEDRIQMHADKLYHDMLAREKATKEAQEKGEKLPSAKPLLDGDEVVKALGEDSAYARLRRDALVKAVEGGNDLPPRLQEAIRAKVKNMDETQRDFELQLLAAEIRAAKNIGEQLSDWRTEESENRRKRREEGKETLSDKLLRYGGRQ